jgi:hypothetical protein
MVCRMEWRGHRLILTRKASVPQCRADDFPIAQPWPLRVKNVDFAEFEYVRS